MAIPQPRPADLEVLVPADDGPGQADAGPRRDLAVILGLSALALALRVLAFPFCDNLFGDAVVRTELAERWLAAPHLITSFNDGVYQFGPLHTYVLAAFLAVWHDRANAGRLSSLLFGVLTVWPTWRVTQRLFGRTAAVWACLGLCFWGMHIQMSVTAGSEALSLCLFAFAIDGLCQGLDEARFGPMARAAVFLNLACAVRYDMWMYVPLFGLAIAMWGSDRLAALTRAVMFTGLALVFPLLWMEGNEKAMGDPLYAVHFIDKFHHQWTQAGVAWLGATRFRLWGLVFWPGTLVLSCSPLFGLACLTGAVRAMVKKQQRLLVIFALVPTVYFTVRTLLLTFSPLARFTVPELWLVLPFAWPGAKLLVDRAPRWLGKAAVGAMALVLVGTPAALAKVCYRADAGWGHTLMPLSPVTTMPADQMQVARWLGANVPPHEALLVDEDDAYTDVGVAFFSNIPEARLVRLRWQDDGVEKFQKRFDQVHPRWVVTFAHGKLHAVPGVALQGDSLTAFGMRYRLVKSFEGGKFEVFGAE